MAAPLWLAMLAEKLVNSRNAAAKQDEERARIANSYASSLGAPTYGVQAAQANRAIDSDPGAGFVQKLLLQQTQDEEEQKRQLGVR